MRFAVTPGVGHKTGFFADQRDARQRVRALAQGRTVLDLFCHAGGFALAAAAGAARRVVAVDLDETEVARAKANAARNKTKVDAQHGDAFDVLRDTKPGAFDLVVLDPPKWADGRSEVEAAMRRYQDLNRLGLERVASGGIVVTCSCSGAVTEGAFLAALRDAAAQARRDARLLWIGGAGPDHPIALECQQTRYLKVVVLQVR
ncbi:MAG: class I SAM-dependent methyltransferase [Planctomycetota bacterium]